MDHEEEFKEFKNSLEEDLKEYLEPLLEKIPAEYRDQAKTLHKDIASYIEKNPWKSVGLAFAAGVLVSRVFRRGDS